jgi:hypothetical protein
MWKTLASMGILQWALAGHTGSHSLPHIDAAGLSTCVKSLQDENIGALEIGRRMVMAKNQYLTPLVMECSGAASRFSEETFFFMPSFTPHLVFTLDDCFAAVGTSTAMNAWREPRRRRLWWNTSSASIG